LHQEVRPDAYPAGRQYAFYSSGKALHNLPPSKAGDAQDQPEEIRELDI
jgi:hypothetical protein